MENISMRRLARMLVLLSAFWTVFATVRSTPSELSTSEKLPQTPVRTTVRSTDLFERIAETTNSVRDLSAQVDFQVRLFSVGLNFDVGGDLYYKQPDRTRLKLHNVPDFLFARQNSAFTTTNILAGLRHDLKWQYDTRIINQTTVQGKICYVIQLVPKKVAGISRILLWVNSENYTMPQVVIHYQDGANLTQRKVYAKNDNVYLVQKMESEYDAPDMKAEILATFRNYRINKGVVDKVFDHEKPDSNPISMF